MNSGGYHLAVLQHEFGLYGGREGAHALCFALQLQVGAPRAAPAGR